MDFLVGIGVGDRSQVPSMSFKGGDAKLEDNAGVLIRSTIITSKMQQTILPTMGRLSPNLWEFHQ
jgi:hypothetical protein